MELNPLEEIQKIKEDLAREGNYDIAVIFEQLRAWSEQNPHPLR